MQSPVTQHTFMGSPIEVNGIKIIPSYRSTVAAFGFGVLATVLPTAIVVVEGQETKVYSLEPSKESGECAPTPTLDIEE